MSSRNQIIQTVSEAAPVGAALGDEWFQPSTNKLFKRMVYSGTVSWTEIPLSISGSLTAQQLATSAQTINATYFPTFVDGNSTSTSRIFYTTASVTINPGSGTLTASNLRTPATSIALGSGAAGTSQGVNSVAIGTNAGTNQGGSAVAIGEGAGQTGQSGNSVAIGAGAGNVSQGANSVAIGLNAGANGQPANTIILNATGGSVNGVVSSSFYVAPIRADASTSATTWGLYYNPVSREITTSTSGGSISPFSGIFTITNVTSSTSTSTGALQVAGGVGIGGTIWATNYRQTAQGVALGRNAGLNNQALQSIAIGELAGSNTQSAFSVAIGMNAGRDNQQFYGVAIGNQAGMINQELGSIAIGVQAGETRQNTGSVAIGYLAAYTTQSSYAVALGYFAGGVNQGTNSIAIGVNAGQTSQRTQSVAIGNSAGSSNQGTGTVAIGFLAGQNSQGLYSVAIGYGAGQTNQPANSIVINADVNGLNVSNASSFYVNPIRTDSSTSATTWGLFYNPVTKEITTSTAGTSASTATNANNIATILRTTSADHFLTFVDSNNASSAYELLYTTSTAIINPATGNFGIGISPTSRLHVSGDVRITGITTVTNTTAATSTITGALQVAGGVGIGGNLYVGGEIVAQKLTIQLTTVTTTLIETDDIIKTSNVTQATATATGALQIAGGASVGGNLWVGGTVFGATVSGTISTATNLAGGTIGLIPIQSAAGTTSFIPAGTSGQLLQYGTNTATFVSTSSIYVGNSLIANDVIGGSAGQLLYQAGVNDTGYVGPGSAGQILVSAGASAPVYTNTASIYVGRALIADATSLANSADALTGGATGRIPIQSSVGTTSFISTGSNGQVLTWSGTTATWASAGVSTTATNLAGGTAGQVPYQSGVGTTAFYGPGTAGQLLQSNGTSAPGYVNTSSIHVGTANFAPSSTTATNATNIVGGTAGRIPIQSAAGTTSFIPAGTSGQLLQYGTNTATFVSTSTLHVETANFAVSSTNATNATNAANVATILRTTNADHFLTFVDSNNAASANELVYTTSSFAINPSTGNVGLGIVSPGAKLDIDSAGAGISNIRLRGPSSDSNWAGGISFVSSNTTTITSDIRVSVNGMLFGYGGSERMRISSNGNVGIGTSTAISLLHVNGTTLLAGISTITNTTNASSTSTGALQVLGGVGIAGNLWVGGTINGTISGTISTATNADNIATVQQTANASYFPVFVNANNATSAYELAHTTSSFQINPQSGNVAVGSAPDTYKFYVSGNALAATTGSQSLIARFNNNNGNVSYLEIADTRVTSGTDWTTAGTRIQQKIDATWMGWIQFNNGSTSSGEAFVSNNQGISFGTGASTASPTIVPETMRLTIDGNLGIGTKSPAARLHVAGGSARITHTSDRVIDFLRTSSNTYSIEHDTARLYFYNVDTTSPLLTFLNGGNVGIGTVNPTARLNVAGTTAFTWVGGGTTTALATFGDQGASGSSLFVNTPSLNSTFASGLAIDGSYSNPGGVGTSTVNLKAVGVNSGGGYESALAFHTSLGTTLSEKMRINSIGNVGINTVSPDTLLHVAGNATTAITRIQNTGAGASTFNPSGAGLELLANGMNTTSKYTPAIKFGSTDPEFTSTNPKFGAAIIAEAIQTYSLDGAGGMDLTFWTSPASPGTGHGLVERMRLDNTGDLGINVTPVQKLHVRTDTTGTDGLMLDTAAGASPWVRVLPSASVGAYNNNVQAGDAAIVYSSGTIRSGTLSISPWNDTALGNGIRMDNTGTVRVLGVNASSTTTGALQVLGGVGIGGNLWVGGTINGTLSGSASSVANALTINNGGSGAASGSTFNGSAAVTISYNTVGAPSTGGANATGTWNIVAGSAVNATNATNIAGGAAGRIPIQSGAGTTSFIPAGSNGNLLQYGATNTATFVSTTTLHVGTSNFAPSSTNATNATNIVGGAAGRIPIQSAAGTTSYIPTGSANQVLTWSGTTATWATPAGGSTVETTARTTNATHFLTFVTDNNAAATAEIVYTTSSFVLNPSTGNVGIGVTPGYRLDVASADTTANVGYAARIRANATAAAGAIQFTDSGATAQYGVLIVNSTGVVTIQGDGASSAIAFRTNGAERARILASGGLAVGTTTDPGSGGIYATGNIYASMGNVSGNGFILSDDGDFVDLNDGYGSFRFTSGIRVFSASKSGTAQVALTSGGAVIAAGDVTAFGSPSDIKLKENIENIPDALKKLLTLNGVNFNYKKDGARSTGVIAQEVEKVLPEVIYETTDVEGVETFKAVRYGNMVGLLIEAIKEQQKIIDDQSATINKLDEKINQILSKLAE